MPVAAQYRSVPTMSACCHDGVRSFPLNAACWRSIQTVSARFRSMPLCADDVHVLPLNAALCRRCPRVAATVSAHFRSMPQRACGVRTMPPVAAAGVRFRSQMTLLGHHTHVRCALNRR
jgi:hypothetical protein